MADSIPICDVLSEAMEYMSKLGTNIRIRSENLKEKRIRKDKLRNTHAIHKAVDKVLLICELSKKSIENVETGVKNLLLQMERAGSSYGPGPETLERPSDVKFEYFTYESRRLKIRNKISVGHYTSVKVVSTSMTLPVLEKYPVYHDCKLYRMRKKKKRREMQASIMDSCTKYLDQLESSEEHTKEKTLDEIDKSKNAMIGDQTISLNEDKNDSKNIQNSKYDNLSSDNKNMKSPEEYKDDSDNEIKYEKKKHTNKTKKFKHVKVIDDDSSNSDKESLLSKETYSKKCTSAEKVREDDENPEKSECNSEKIRPMSKCDDKTKKFKHVKVIDDDSSNSDKESLLSKETHSKKSRSAEKDRVDDETSEKSECNSEKIRPMIKCDDKTKKFKHVKVIDDDSSNSDKESLLSKETYSKKTRSAEKDREDDETSQKSECNSEKKRPMIKCVDKTEKFKHVKVIDDDSSNSDKESLLSKETYSNKSRSAEKDREDEETSQKSECNSEKIRPMIKCVSLDKLLKPERVKKIDDETKNSKKKDKSEKRRERHSQSESRREERHKRTRRLDTSDEEDDYAYWARKRKEVKQFKAMDFSINVNRLPKITTMLLERYNITRITQNGSVLCEKVREIGASASFSDELEPKSKRMKISNSTGNIDLDKVKSALLDDSDSDISEHKQLEIAEKHDLHGRSDTEMIDTIYEHTNFGKKSQSNIEDLATDNSDKLKNPEKTNNSGEGICESEVQNYKFTCSQETDSKTDDNIKQEEKNNSLISNSSKEIGERKNESENNFIANRAEENITEDNTKDGESISDLKDSEGLQEEVYKDKNSQQIGFDCKTSNSKNVEDSVKSKDVLSDSHVVLEMSTKQQEVQKNKNGSDDEIVLKKRSQMVKKTLKNRAVNDSECDVRKKTRVKKIVNRVESDESDPENETKEKSNYESENLEKSKKISLDNEANIQFDKETLEDQTTHNTLSSKQDNEDNKEEQSDTSKRALLEIHNGREEDNKCNKPEHLDFHSPSDTDTDMHSEEIAQKDSETLNDYSGSSEVKRSENERDKGDSVIKDHFLANRSGSENEDRKHDNANSPKESDHNTHILEKQNDIEMSKSSLSVSEHQNKKKKNPGNGKIDSQEYNKAIPNQSIKSPEKPKPETENLSDKKETHEVKNNLLNECYGDAGNQKTDFNKTDGNANKVIDNQHKVRAKKSRKTLSNAADPEAAKAEKNTTTSKEPQYQNGVGASNKDKRHRSCTHTNSDEVKKTLSYESDFDTFNQESVINTVGPSENETEKKDEIKANNVNKCQLNESDSVAHNKGRFSDAKRNSDKTQDSQDESEGVNTLLLNEIENNSDKATENEDEVNSKDIKKSCPNVSDSVTDNRGSCDETELNFDEETGNQDEVNSDGVKESLLNESVSKADKQESCKDSERYDKEAQNQDQVNSEGSQSASDICNNFERNSDNETDNKNEDDSELNSDKEADNKDEDNSELHSDKEAGNEDKDNSKLYSAKETDNQNEINTEEVKQSLLNESDSDADKQESCNTERYADKGTDNKNEDNSELYSDKETENPNEFNTEEVKQSLLNESDSDADKQDICNTEKKSDKETENYDVNTEEVKKYLLNQSDSDTDNRENIIIYKKIDEDTGNKDELNTEEIKKSLLNESDSDAGQQQSRDNSERYSVKETDYENEVNAEEVKKSLLNESDSDADNQESCKISNENSDKVTVNKDEVSAEEIKKSLLNESDSDADKGCSNSERTLIKETGDHNEVNADEVMKSLLNESYSDVNKQDSNNTINNPNDEKDNEDEGNTDEFKKSLLNESDCDANIQDRCIKTEVNSNNEPEPINQGEVNELEESLKQRKRRSGSAKDTEIVKSSLLKDSSDDRIKTPIKRKSFGRDSPPRSKRKHIMESMYARKMLLTYSSSSDTEDEQLRNTLKEIKNYLLKGISSDEGSANESRKNSADTNGTVKGNDSKEDSSGSDELSPKKITKPKAIKRENSDSDSSSKPTCGSESSNKKKMGRSRATRADSCSQNSDMLDDKEIDGLTNLKTLKKSQRRRDSSTDNTQSTRSGRRLRMAKAGGLISNEGFLQAESSSDAASLSGSDHADNADAPDLEEMPRVKLSDINGDGIVGHLAKDDLLGESDTSISHDEKRDSKRGDDTDDERVKSKRRKGLAISSDSEAGSSRRKDHIRLSDFEDSEDESSEPVKSKRKKKGSDSDASGSSGDGKKKRRRIKTLDDSDGSGSDTENEGRNKHGRKNIRKVMGKNQLEEATKKAAREEKERIARIAERQKLYNNLEFDESGKPDEVVLEKVVLDFDPETKEPLIQVDRGLVKKLKPHQANGIKFMWDACFESVKRIKKDKGSGCILAHCMGLGKTLQVVSLTHTLLTHSTLTGVNRVLVVCPLSTVLNWVNEFRMWLKHAEADFDVDVYELSKFKQNSERAFQLSQWFEHGGVCVLGYEMFRNLSADNVKKFKKKMLKNFQESLVDPGPDLVVCDEGHLLKNEKTSLSQSMNRVKTLRRIVLTGTPLQNNLKEYYCMVQFVKPNLLGKYNEYLNRFVNPITNGQYTDSTEHDIRVMKRRSHVLHKMLDGAVQRRDYGVLAPFLPPKHEYVLFITLTDLQIKLYQHYLDNYSRRPLPGKSSGFLFPDFQSLQRIWTHPLVLKYNSERYEIMQQKKREREEEEESEGSLLDFINDDSTPDESSTEESTDDSSDLSDDSRKKSKKKKSAKKGKGKDGKAAARRGTRANPIEGEEEDPIESLEVKNENPTEWWMKLVSEDELEDMRNSSKLVLLFDILRQCEAIGDKLLVFSQSLYSLDLIEHFLGKVDDATQEGRVDEKLGGHVGSWSPGVDYFRLDGSTSCENRSIWCKNFNREDNPRARLFLISTRAGGLGINLVAANRVVIFDVSWNPSHDVQSIFRVYRFGQKKPCYIYRFLAMGTMEEKIYERQVTKQAISKRVIDEQQIDRHYAENDLAELYKFEPQPPLPRPLPPLPKDRLFAEMLREHEAQIYKYHEHDSLLENKEEETLSEEERKAAWEDFENEKTRPPPQPLLSPYAMHNGMMPGLIAQQQQLMYAAVAAMVRKDMPNMNDQQIRDAVSLIYNANANPAMYGGYDYGAMQKIGDLYKYAQPGMMNPGMMNAMNAAGGAGGMGMGGASGLQYEPPWQRQQQQQQQMRLQQLMQQQQQQNSMGAKYYAGGLGSRDPMAMALQQQRARELMLRPRARGRPPLQPAGAPRPPPAHGAHAAAAAAAAGDVVNLDSD